VQPAAERALRRGHPWLYADAIREQSHEGQPGDLAVIFDRKRRFLAVGLYDPHSPIRVRVLQHNEPAPIDGDWFRQKIAAAVRLRRPLEESLVASQPTTTGYRLIHGENDGLPALVVDRYERTYVLKLYSTAWVPHLPQFIPALLDEVPVGRLVLRLSRAVAEQRQHLYELRGGQVLYGPVLEGPVRFRENGLLFAADVVQGQKTGFFFDHRDNRARVEQLAGGKRVLNVFAYTGAFSLYAARGGAPLVVSLDLSQPALAAAMENFRLNRENRQVAAAEHEALVGDAFRSLQELQRNERRFEMVIVDPPSFAQSQAELPGALNAYRKLVRQALSVLKPGGTLVMASCTSRIPPEQFFDTVHQAAASAGRPLQELERTGHALDHPIGFPEGAYLKCLFAVG
jgi:23S rRNA (cytosine1962-C5)-methyltransferase